MSISYNGAGLFQINSSGQPVVSGTVISSTVFNALTADLATGLSTAITKDGQTATSARIPFLFGISSTLTTDSTSIGTGSIITSGGVGVTKALWVGGLANIAGAVTLQSTLAVTGAVTFTSTLGMGALTATTGTFSSTAQSTTYQSTSSIIYMGGTTSSEVSLRRSSTELLIKLGDSSDYATAKAKDFIADSGRYYFAGATATDLLLKNSTITMVIRKGDDSANGNLTCGTLTPDLFVYTFGGVTATRDPATITSQTFVDGILMAES